VKTLIKFPINVEVPPTFLAEWAREEQMESGFLTQMNKAHNYSCHPGVYVFFLPRMFLTFSLSIINSQVKTFILLAQLECGIY
jgi:hypothetical protein